MKQLPGGPLSIVLFWFGGACVAMGLVVGVQAAAVPAVANDLGRIWLMVPAWGAVAVTLALLLRRVRSYILTTVAQIWLLIAAGGAIAYVWMTPHA